MHIRKSSFFPNPPHPAQPAPAFREQFLTTYHKTSIAYSNYLRVHRNHTESRGMGAVMQTAWLARQTVLTVSAEVYFCILNTVSFYTMSFC